MPHEPEVVLGVVVEVIGELGQLAGADHALPLDHEGRVDLLIAVLAGVQVEHEGDEGPLQPGAQPLEDVEAGAGELDAALEIDDAQVFAQLPVGGRRESRRSSALPRCGR